jgi:hypothetical protein
VIGVVMTVDLFEHLDRHPEIPGGLPHVDAELLSSWHCFNSSILATSLAHVTNLPAIFLRGKKPFPISVRNERSVIRPPGKNRDAASSRL